MLKEDSIKKLQDRDIDIPEGPIDWTDPRYSPTRLIELFRLLGDDEDPDDAVPAVRMDIDISTRRYPIPDLNPMDYGVCSISDKGKLTLDKWGAVDYFKMLRIVCDTKGFYMFDGCIYRQMKQSDIEAVIYRELKRCTGLPMPSRSVIADIVSALQATSRWSDIDIPDAWYDDHRYDGDLIPFKNGIYNIDTDELLPFSPFLFMTNQLEAYYNPRAGDKEIERIYRRIIPDEGTFRFFMEMVGYTLFSPTLSHPALFMIYGPGNTGKSALQEAVVSALGCENRSTLDLAQLSGEFTRAELDGKIMNVCGETGSGQSRDMSKSDGELLKKLAEGQPVTVRHIYGKPFQMVNTAKLWFVTNTLPDFGDTSSGFQRRIYIIPCRVAQRWEDQIYTKMQTEDSISWLINQALAGYKRFLANGKKFDLSREMLGEKATYRAQDAVFDFVEDYTGQSEPEKVAKMLDGMEIRELYEIYKDHILQTGGKPLSMRKMSERIRNEYRLGTSKTRGMQANGRPTNITVFTYIEAI